jgi:hypothetical protein
MFYGLEVYGNVVGDWPRAWRAFAALGNVGGLLAILGFVSAAGGQGPPRILLMLLAVIGLFLWVPVAFL